ncbi:cysteine-rich CWC family protein [Alkalihalobacterium alkalinitrilicum]|uniref:cysteine-rich CWC family protein n=1 Tax=Alkalihalobacterium alkalinitrilicum TaxID=427920 RepID=UPI0009950676|nr:cysteine-rich CWC family protein [Alkalihalobacterium alkalinitrilicum]
MTIDAKKCPICNKDNRCGNEQNQPSCWCSMESFPDEIFKLISDEKRNKACICKECLERYNQQIRI